MWPPTHPRWRRSSMRSCLVLAAAWSAVFTPLCTLASVKVDTELILLVDVSGSVTSGQFSSLMGSYARAITSSSVVDAIQSGDFGKIAATLVFWGGETDQMVAVPWMEISNQDQAAQFASLLLSATRPFEGKTALGSALNYATPLFGDETGGKDNGFSSLMQIIDVSGDGVDNSTPPRGDRAANVRAARDHALASGVDMINGLPIGDTNGSLVAYYRQNVIGGSAGDTEAFTEEAKDYVVLEKALVSKLTREITAGAEAGQVVPEPSTAVLTMSGLIAACIRRRGRPQPSEPIR